MFIPPRESDCALLIMRADDLSLDYRAEKAIAHNCSKHLDNVLVRRRDYLRRRLIMYRFNMIISSPIGINFWIPLRVSAAVSS